MALIKPIRLPSTFDSYINIDRTPISELSPISNVNIFVGANNSGKSRFARMLAAEADYQVTFEEIDLERVNSQINEILEKIT